jgi:dihydrofolate reductase
VRIGGGAATVQQYLRAGLIDDLHLVIVPILLSPLPSSSTGVVEKLLARDAGEPRLELFG